MILSEIAQYLPDSKAREIVKVQFIDCDLWGPAVIAIGTGNLIDDCTELDRDPEEAIRGVRAGDELMPSGLLFVDNCLFGKCRFHDVEIVVPAGFEDQVRAKFIASKSG